MILLNGYNDLVKKFPNNEAYVMGSAIKAFVGYKEGDSNVVTLRYDSDVDLIHLMFVKEYLDSMNEKASLDIHYMPYSRMDRVEGDSVFTLKYISKMINSLNFTKVTVYEPHSDVTMALLDRSVAIYPTVDMVKDLIDEIDFDPDKDFIYYPDAGAEKRYSKFFNYNSLVGLKKRDFESGRITKLDVVGDVKEVGFKVIMVDDLCSRGGTFMLGGEKLRELGASKIYLVVGHCENTILDGEILTSDVIDEVWTTNSIFRHSFIPKMKIKNLVESAEWEG